MGALLNSIFVGRVSMADTTITADRSQQFRPELMGDYTIKVKGWDLDEVPKKVLEKWSAKVLILSRNRIDMLPPDIGNLRALTVLKIDQNRLTTLPPELGNLVELAELHVTDNMLNTVPVELGAIKALKKINLAGNPLMHTLPGSERPLWEIYYGDKAGPMPKSQIECLRRPTNSSGTIKIRTSVILRILRRALEAGVPRSSTGPGAGSPRRVLEETGDSVRTEVLDLGGGSSGLLHPDLAGKRGEETVATMRKKDVPREMGRGANSSLRQKRRGRWWKKCLFVGAVIGGIAGGVLFSRRLQPRCMEMKVMPMVLRSGNPCCSIGASL
ncbi:hypothetical protein BSKO_04861 [Bryopsis sp. KO-2023]|nr:hypothetical protein BSKO_04861 [Bryopsis sp. KO-2023]